MRHNYLVSVGILVIDVAKTERNCLSVHGKLHCKHAVKRALCVQRLDDDSPEAMAAAYQKNKTKETFGFDVHGS